MLIGQASDVHHRYGMTHLEPPRHPCKDIPPASKISDEVAFEVGYREVVERRELIFMSQANIRQYCLGGRNEAFLSKYPWKASQESSGVKIAANSPEYILTRHVYLQHVAPIPGRIVQMHNVTVRTVIGRCCKELDGWRRRWTLRE